MQNINKNINIKGITYLSVLKYVSNNLSGENIAIGMLAVSEEQAFFKISKRKIDLVKRLNADAGKLIEFSVAQLNKVFSEDIKKSGQHKLLHTKILSLDYLNRLSVYNNGVLQFSNPQSFNVVFEEKDFEGFFKKFISDDSEKSLNKEVSPSHIKEILKQNFYIPLKDKIDVDFTLRKQQLPSLLFDFHLDGIGANGAMYAVKSIDVNAQKNATHLKIEISEYESVLDRLTRFGESIGLSGVPQYHLIFEEYNGHIPSLIELSCILKQNTMPLFKVSSAKDVNVIADSIIQNKAKKFSEVLLNL
ncbi:MAG: hypothetical protein Q8L90_19210 [Bacteroidota bacterium]|nr:hypothetical protein [Bacteroidota bacterium]